MNQQPGPNTGAGGKGAGPGWMAPPPDAVHCPPGLEYLTMIDNLLVQQQVELLEAFTGFETQNKYVIKNSLGQGVFFAAEDSCCLWRQCCGKNRPFQMRILDNIGREVMHLRSPLRCETCWFPCCLKKVVVEAPPGVVIGYVNQTWSICKPQFAITDANGDKILRIQGPLCTCSLCFKDVVFQVYTADGNVPIGQIHKAFSGFVKELFTDADNFGVSFPMDLDVKVKASLLAAVFLIDYMFFEKSGNKEDIDIGMF